MNHPPDPEVAQGGYIGGRPVVGDKEGYAPGGSGLTTDRQRIPSLRFRPVGGCLAQKGGQGRRHHRPLCRRHAGTDVKLMGCKSPDPNRPFGDLAGGRVGGANRRFK